MPEPLRAVLDSTVLVSAFLAEGKLSAELLRFARRGAFILCSSNSILAETQRVLMEYRRIRRRYQYEDQKVFDYVEGLHVVARLSADLPAIKAVRDPHDDVVIATALASEASHLVTRDKDLLSLGTHEGITITSPEDFMALLRKRS